MTDRQITADASHWAYHTDECEATKARIDGMQNWPSACNCKGRTHTEDEKVNPVCAIGSVAASVVLLCIILFVAAFIFFSLGVSTQSWPRLPRAVGWFCDAWTIGYVALKLYPKCMKARIARRLSHG